MDGTLEKIKADVEKDKEEKAAKAAQGFVSRNVIALGVVFAIIVVLLYIKIDSVEQNLSDATLVNREAGYKNRAQTCRINLTLGTPPDQQCLEPEVVKYYDPTVQPTVGEKSSTRSLMCKNSDDLNEIRVAIGLPNEEPPAECKYFPRG